MGGRAESPLDGRNGRLAALGWRKRKNEVKYAEACSSSTPGSRNVNSDNMEKNIDSTLQSSTSFEPHFKKKKCTSCPCIYLITSSVRLPPGMRALQERSLCPFDVMRSKWVFSTHLMNGGL
ncbi:protein FAM200B isoform X2 [Ursus maritimus]|uniref:Protein FAM200B isoform X2 n=1 Tax=Ursus maritimus TaxID=29073 RepID=A0A8M1FJP1_URSMA|nr:protein FAM200B isoform X2 [Ursus maritimus]